MIAVVYTDEGPEDGEGACYTRASRSVHLYDNESEAEACVRLHAHVTGRRNPRLEVFDSGNGDCIIDNRGESK